MTRRGTLLATGLGALAIGVAGCGGGGGGAAVGTTNDMGTVTAGATTTTTGTSTGGVLGAQANVDRQRLRQEANRIQMMLNRQVEQLRGASSTEDLAAAATSIRAQLLKAANRLDRMQVQSPQLQQQRGDLESALRSLAADVTTLKGDAQTGNLQKAMTDLTNLSSLTQVQARIDRIQQQAGNRATTQGARQQLRSTAATTMNRLTTRLVALGGTNDAKVLANRLSSLARFLNTQEDRVKGLNVPQSLQDERQALLAFLHQWEATIEASRGEAAHGRLNEAKQQLRSGSLSAIGNLLMRLSS